MVLYEMAISKEKACKILEDGSANGQEITDKQRKFFGAICGGQKVRKAASGAIVVDYEPDMDYMACCLEDPEGFPKLVASLEEVE